MTTTRRPKSRKIPLPSRSRDPFLPLPAPQGLVVNPNDFTPSHDKVERPVVPARGDMTVEKFLKTLGRGIEEHVGKIPTWDDLMKMRSEDLKTAGISVPKQRRYILKWVENYRHGVDPRHLPIMSRSKKNKFVSRRKVKTREQKRRD